MNMKPKGIQHVYSRICLMVIYVVMMPLWCPFLEPYQTTYHSNIGVLIRKVTEFKGMSTLISNVGFWYMCTIVFPQVPYSLLVLFSGMFITVEGFNNTGAPTQLWNVVEPYAHINTASGVAVLSLIVTIMSNVASNVPTGIYSSPFFFSLLYYCTLMVSYGQPMWLNGNEISKCHTWFSTSLNQVHHVTWYLEI